MNDLGRIRAGERERAGEHLVERDAEGVEVGAPVDHPVHPPGLLGRQVGQRALERAGAGGFLRLLREAGRDAEIDDAGRGRPGVDHDVVGLDVLVNDLEAVERVEGVRERDRQRQRGGDVERAGPEDVMERGGAEILEDQGEAPAIFLQRDPFAHAGQVANVLEDTELTP